MTDYKKLYEQNDDYKGWNYDKGQYYNYDEYSEEGKKYMNTMMRENEKRRKE